MITLATHIPTGNSCQVIETTPDGAIVEFTRGRPVSVRSFDVLMQKFILRGGESFEPSQEFKAWQDNRQSTRRVA